MSDPCEIGVLVIDCAGAVVPCFFVVTGVGVVTGAAVAVSVAVVSLTENPSTAFDPAIKIFVKSRGTSNTIIIFLLKIDTKYPTIMKKIIGVMFPITIYPNILVTAKNNMTYKTYLFSNNFETDLGIFIYLLCI
jgi:hypothetical protein